MGFHVRQRVVFVGYDPKTIPSGWKPVGIPWPKIDEIYTIIAIHGWPPASETLELAELDHCQPNVLLRGYRSDGFRPIVERKTDISIFTALLNPSRTPERVHP